MQSASMLSAEYCNFNALCTTADIGSIPYQNDIDNGGAMTARRQLPLFPRSNVCTPKHISDGEDQWYLSIIESRFSAIEAGRRLSYTRRQTFKLLPPYPRPHTYSRKSAAQLPWSRRNDYRYFPDVSRTGHHEQSMEKGRGGQVV